MANGYFPPGRGGNDPARQAAIQQLSRVPVSRPDVQAQAPPVPPQAAPGGAAPGGAATGPMMQQAGMQPGPAGISPSGLPGSSAVAFHLASAFQALVQEGPSMENLAAVKQFVYSIAQLHSPQAAQGGQATPAGPVGVTAPQGGPTTLQAQPLPT